MRREILVAGLCLLALNGCGRRGSDATNRMSAVLGAPDLRSESSQFSFVNFWAFEMKHDSIALRFERTRAACISNKPLNCKLLTSNINTASGGDSSTASLDVLLPHGQIEGFKKSILAPVAGESPEDVALRSSNTRAENVGDESADANRDVLRLTAYRDRLMALSKRPNLNIEDTIRLEGEISRVQGELDKAIKAKSDTDNRIARETVNITFEERPASAIGNVFSRAADTFTRNAADALEFLIGAIPWLPIVAAATLLITWLIRLLWRRKQKS